MSSTVSHRGSILGPLLFLIYINDIESSTDENLVLFGDDTTAITKSKHLELLIARMKQTLVNLERWFRLSLNVNKTEQIIFSLRNVSSQLQDENLSDSVKFLGVYLDGTLVFDQHIEQIAKKLSQVIFLLRTLRGAVDHQVLLMVFNALFQSHCSYAILTWGHTAQARIVFKLQSRAIRVVGGQLSKADVEETFMKLKILTLPPLFILCSLVYVINNLDRYSLCCNNHYNDTRYKKNIHLDYMRLKKITY